MGLIGSIDSYRKRHKVYTLKEISAIAAPIAEKYGTGRIQVFGSYARGEATPDSDIDLLITPGKIRSYFKFATLAADLEDAFGKKVDAVSSGCDKRFIDRIRADSVTVYEVADCDEV